ncbi:phospholipase D family protein [Sandarakinorhabdus sp. DWP1-3-1]|uniref:phospholipase D family protein n=1 Tax=Sandarakinorhabdus sp. DWP1-3-1 TaxID=2804627 RepID=UPI003CF2D15C
MSWLWLVVPALGWLALWWAGRLPRRRDRPASAAYDDTADTALGRAVAMAAAANPGLSGVRLVSDPADALNSRLALVAAAERCIDIQYYIWRADASGRQLLAALRAAADRGVRVRLLLDDNGIGGLDQLLAALDSHAGVEIRLFNPFVIRRPKVVGYLTDFPRLNRRMHNKSMTVDNQVTIIGGRNIGDEYFGRHAQEQVADLDVLAVGAIVPMVSADFDRYWACRSAWPTTRILPPATLGSDLALSDDPGAAASMPDLAEGLEWVPVWMVSDDPAKGLGRARTRGLIGTRLRAAIGQPRHRLGLVSPYFVPTDSGVTSLAALTAAGVSVDVLTNSLKANNVAVVHAGYAPSRRPLLRAGVRLWELKGAHPEKRARLKLRRGVVRGSAFKSSGTALHAKTFTVDGEKMFVGSLNLDPRSARLNTEIGFVIESRTLAAGLQGFFDGDIAQAAYEVKLDGRRLRWIERDGDRTIIHDHEPGTGPLQRAVIWVASHLPAKWLL